MKKLRHCLTLLDFSPQEISKLLRLAIRMKKDARLGKSSVPLKGKLLAMIFEKSSTRTRVSFEAAMFQLGGGSIVLDTEASQLGRGESYEDTSRVLSRYVQGIMLRTFSQENLEKMASVASVPVINGLSDLFHPVQVLADLQTLVELKKNLATVKVTYIGDGNNLAHSWMQAAMQIGFPLHVSCPRGFEPAAPLLEQAKKYPHIRLIADPVEAVRGQEVIYTDTWFSMGQKENEKKRRLFVPYQVNARLLSHAHARAVVLHCLPAHRGEEITDEVIDGPQSQVWRQAENRLHVQKALLKTLMG